MRIECLNIVYGVFCAIVQVNVWPFQFPTIRLLHNFFCEWIYYNICFCSPFSLIQLRIFFSMIQSTLFSQFSSLGSILFDLQIELVQALPFSPILCSYPQRSSSLKLFSPLFASRQLGWSCLLYLSKSSSRCGPSVASRVCKAYVSLTTFAIKSISYHWITRGVILVDMVII